jgi:hypothetical protein
MMQVETFACSFSSKKAQGVLAQVGDGRGIVDDCRGNGRARLRYQIPERFPVKGIKV